MTSVRIMRAPPTFCVGGGGCSRSLNIGLCGWVGLRYTVTCVLLSYDRRHDLGGLAIGPD